MVRGYVLRLCLWRLRERGGLGRERMNGSSLGEPRLLGGLEGERIASDVFLARVEEFEPAEKLRALAVDSA